MAMRGNRGHFHGEPLEFLLGYVSLNFWTDFDPAWDTAYPKITPEEMGELEEEEANLADAITNTRALNEQVLKGKSRRKAVILPIPIPGARLCELRACAVDETKLHTWFSYQKTKDKTRKVELFRTWLNAILSAHGPPRRIKMGWVLWRDPAHGEALQVLYREKFAKNADDDNGDREGKDGFEKEDGREEEEEEAPVGRTKLLHDKYHLAMEYFKQLGRWPSREGKKAEEKEVEEEEEEEEDAWPGGGSDDEEDDGEEDDEEEEETSSPPPIALTRVPKTPLRKAVEVLERPARQRHILELNCLSDYEFEREENIAWNKELLGALKLQGAAASLGIAAKAQPKPRARHQEHAAPTPPARSSCRLALAAGAASPTPDVGTPPLFDGAVSSSPASEGAPPLHDGTVSPAAGHDADASSNEAPALMEEDLVTPEGRHTNDAAAPAPPALLERTAADETPAASATSAPALPRALPASTAMDPDPVSTLDSAPVASLAALLSPSSEKHDVVLEAWRSEIQLPSWTAVVQAWHALEQATVFQVVGKALPTHGRPKAVHWWIPPGLDDEDGKEDFYVDVVKWWVGVNADWRKEGVTTAQEFKKHGLRQECGDDLKDLYAGLNGITGVVACLWWWYRIAKVAGDEPAAKRARVV
ncbi:hypothetical protein K438DRAFT_1969110 [Mycena galopus ATCC 62051]|nr:hypothetical protein K438DRAFT_1969110 [Mycena galopus ATCC 62051]